MKKLVLIVLFVFSTPSFATNADIALEYCEKAIELEGARSEQFANFKLASFCSTADRTAESWKCIVLSMESNEYSLTQAISDCDNR